MPSWNGHFRSATDPKFGVRISCTAVYTGRFSGIFVKTVHKKLSCRGPRRGSFRDALLEWAFSRCDGPQIRGANFYADVDLCPRPARGVNQALKMFNARRAHAAFSAAHRS
jgi:hypothetical protein